MTIGSEIRRLRKAKGLNQQQLASKSGVTTNTVSRIETGETAVPELNTLAAIARVLGVTKEQLSAAFESAGQPTVEQDAANEHSPLSVYLRAKGFVPGTKRHADLVAHIAVSASDKHFEDDATLFELLVKTFIDVEEAKTAGKPVQPVLPMAPPESSTRRRTRHDDETDVGRSKSAK